MSLTPRMTMIGLYNYDNALFDKLSLPEGIIKEDFINSFLLKYGECPVIYPQWEFMQFALGVWGKKWYHSIERIIYAFKTDYNPLHNFDRHEEYTDTEDIDRANTAHAEGTAETDSESSENSSNTADNTTDTENTVSAYNANTYQPDNKSVTTEDREETGTRSATGNVTESNSLHQTGTDNTDRELQHTGHLYGNIGVTESTTMLMHEKELRENYSIIDIVCDMLYREICIYVY